MEFYTSGEQEDLDGTELADILDSFEDDTTIFCRIEKGEETYHIRCTNDLRRVPKGTQVLIR